MSAGAAQPERQAAAIKEAERKKIFPDESKWSVLETVRLKGYALSSGEREEGLFGLAVPILDAEGELVAAASMSGPTVRFENETLTDKITSMVKMGQRISAAWNRVAMGTGQPE